MGVWPRVCSAPRLLPAQREPHKISTPSPRILLSESPRPYADLPSPLSGSSVSPPSPTPSATMRTVLLVMAVMALALPSTLAALTFNGYNADDCTGATLVRVPELGSDRLCEKLELPAALCAGLREHRERCLREFAKHPGDLADGIIDRHDCDSYRLQR